MWNKRLCQFVVIYLFVPLCTYLFFFGSYLSKFADHLPDPGDSFHNTWILANSFRSLIRCGIECVYNANIYYPIKNAGVFAETLIAESAIFHPIFILSGNPQLAFNLVTALCFVLTQVSCVALFSRLGAHSFVATILSIVCTYLPFRIPHSPHTQLISMFLVIFPLVVVVAYFQNTVEAKRRMLLLLFVILVQIKVCSFGYNTFLLYLLLLVFIGGVFIRAALRRESKVLKQSLTLGVATAILFVVNCVLFYKPYLLAAAGGMKRDLSTIQFYAADIMYFLSAPASNLFYGALTAPLRKLDYNGEISALFIGCTPFFLFFYGLGRLRALPQGEEKTLPSALRIPLLIGLSVFALLSVSFILGPQLKWWGGIIGDNYLFLALWKIGVGQFTRYTPAFIQALVLVLSCLLALLYAQRSLCGYGERIFLSCVVFFACFEYRFTPPSWSWSYTQNTLPPVYEFLVTHPAPDRPLVELPIQTGYSPAAEYFTEQMFYMYFSIYHHRPLMNGQSGFFPDEFVKNSAVLHTFPSETSLELLRKLKVQTVLFHKKKYLGDLGEKKFEAIKKSHKIRILFEDAQSESYVLRVG